MAKDSRPGFFFLISPDSALVNQQLDSLLSRFPPSSGDWKRRTFWGDENPDEKFWESLKQQGLFAENRAVVVRRAHEWPASIWKSLDGVLSSGSSSIWPLFCLESEYEKGRFKLPQAVQKARCYHYAQKQGWQWSCPPLAGKMLRRYVEVEAAKRKLSFVPQALELFCGSLRPDASTIGNELDKLSLALGEGEIVPELLALDSSSPEANAFECLKNLYFGNIEKVWREISRTSASSLLFFLIALLARDFHIFWEILLGREPYLHPSDAALKREIANRLGHGGIGQGFVLLANAEHQVKSGKLNPEQALEQLLIELSGLFAP